MAAKYLGPHLHEDHAKRDSELLIVGDKVCLACKWYPCVYRETKRSRHWHCLCGRNLARFRQAASHIPNCKIAQDAPLESCTTLQEMLACASPPSGLNGSSFSTSDGDGKSITDSPLASVSSDLDGSCVSQDDWLNSLLLGPNSGETVSQTHEDVVWSAAPDTASPLICQPLGERLVVPEFNTCSPATLESHNRTSMPVSFLPPTPSSDFSSPEDADLSAALAWQESAQAEPAPTLLSNPNSNPEDDVAVVWISVIMHDSKPSIPHISAPRPPSPPPRLWSIPIPVLSHMSISSLKQLVLRYMKFVDGPSEQGPPRKRTRMDEDIPLSPSYSPDDMQLWYWEGLRPRLLGGAALVGGCGLRDGDPILAFFPSHKI
ncbi:uncharacterized protein SPPG_00012 [Spizellomyces punctatus DAOM BR117]|uniref:Uncharacterized protein n=1 Tax=Spizellomyces punctatus (strain DAOM BR117) TaxID=645134 RepID=A0A0L0HTT1_SPIPD|nr:uncharacterized protein SPPG_00012 [Spizellomyces punctatus DAOM BR117]KND04274.1 hypothetical protein SPPG_00012 [Spizellomyces punctatus DAOM BR117]|eukprot:XP_016612313.1 hypothetical protein SPPG_00012 [Spizellomyces punctatus DAOM BR117]